MRIDKVKAIFFSPTGNAKKVAETIADELGQCLNVPVESVDFTLPRSRESRIVCEPYDLAVFCTPTYAGRIPNKILPWIQENIEGNGAFAIAAAVYGNRSYDNALMELKNELEAHGFHTVAGAAVPTEHVFNSALATGRPDEKDLTDLRRFADETAEKISGLESIPLPLVVPGEDPVGPYYTPLGIDGKPAVFLKAKPAVDPDRCDKCGVCSLVCPMGSIPSDAPDTTTGTCIKCQACIKKCPKGARYFDDPAFLSHVEYLVEHFTGPKEAEWYL